MKQHIPNFVTCLNLVCGCLSILYAQTDLQLASVFILAATLFDFLDGFVARLLHVKSSIGIQLDSLADVVSFGVAPGFIMYVLFFYSGDSLSIDYDLTANYWALAGFILPCAGAVRLAKFNIDTRQVDGFLGLPIPSMAYVVASFPFLLNVLGDNLRTFLLYPITLIFIILLLSGLMLSEIPLISLKFKSYGFAENKSKYILLIVCAGLLAWLKLAALPLCIAAYIIISLTMKEKKIA